jgi:hypothetical protein
MVANVECNWLAEDSAKGWCGYRADLPEEDEVPELVLLCCVRRAGVRAAPQNRVRPFPDC